MHIDITHHEQSGEGEQDETVSDAIVDVDGDIDHTNTQKCANTKVGDNRTSHCTTQISQIIVIIIKIMKKSICCRHCKILIRNWSILHNCHYFKYLVAMLAAAPHAGAPIANFANVTHTKQKLGLRYLFFSVAFAVRLKLVFAVCSSLIAGAVVLVC